MPKKDSCVLKFYHSLHGPRTFVIFSNDFRDRFFEIICRKRVWRAWLVRNKNGFLKAKPLHLSFSGAPKRKSVVVEVIEYGPPSAKTNKRGSTSKYWKNILCIYIYCIYYVYIYIHVWNTYDMNIRIYIYIISKISANEQTTIKVVSSSSFIPPDIHAWCPKSSKHNSNGINHLIVSTASLWQHRSLF